MFIGYAVAPFWLIPVLLLVWLLFWTNLALTPLILATHFKFGTMLKLEFCLLLSCIYSLGGILFLCGKDLKEFWTMGIFDILTVITAFSCLIITLILVLHSIHIKYEIK